MVIWQTRTAKKRTYLDSNLRFCEIYTNANKGVCILCILEVKGRRVLALNLFIWLDGKKLTYFDSNFRVCEIYTNANKGFDNTRALALNKEGTKLFYSLCVCKIILRTRCQNMLFKSVSVGL